MASAAAFTCITCHVAFSDGEIQREHYKSDWHRYNLKRKVAELPHVTAERFRERVLAQQALQPAAPSAAGPLYCQPCRKPFKTDAQHRNHLQSKKHQDQQRAWDADAEARQQRLIVAEQNRKNLELSGQSEKEAGGSWSPRRPQRKGIAPPPEPDSESDSDDDLSVEEVDSDEWEEWDEGEGIPPSSCLFCPHASADLAANLRHMTQAHSFFVPDAEFVTDMEGLVTYLGQKVGEGFVCLWCNERGKHFTSVDAVQKHMRDKGHTKMLHEGEVLAEYADYYDYSTSYPDGADADSEPLEPEQLNMHADGFQLVLPSGATVGHRALVRYYRQHLKPEKAVALRKTGAATTARDVLHQYRLMGWTGSSKEQLKKTARDMMALRRHQQRSDMRLGVKANRLQKHYREQNPM
ncbi:zinc finger protein 622-like [Amphibalanus amphitrite]|uniref:zinc finger protein 622-like n=1 Tax=Amphibalanus amphitrite TaxID=1232801 RepID=UPI001C9200D3|nr:zinc finger protein 622-like [Amphibalanus amphitrite]XP_043204399.1 zinc finger protein 622-like [Amphibalanus amphitrite]XP_043204400.1 zinc finger protein 622-like [Amphibalanus amphitrite]XP_043204401.1 zinc finger protein 622-like [Amphibalanus amphitrite]XP_043204402.1 zinc finger protein 622-like [Amphibalanus amphitrite]XP_043204403.1 zinc finger protein 622-like [Amphibalanus amphitrite]XP_043204404.1 zinc finger protein 622-like [Amphibalanus amphitrite]XP_043204405.1 zinc finge